MAFYSVRSERLRRENLANNLLRMATLTAAPA
jgi:hypothetical protein